MANITTNYTSVTKNTTNFAGLEVVQLLLTEASDFLTTEAGDYIQLNLDPNITKDTTDFTSITKPTTSWAAV